MRQPNYKLGWYVPNQIAALTHFHPDVTAEDFEGVVGAGQELFQHVGNEFHVIIDNRVVGMSFVPSLSQMQQMVPYMNHPLLRWVVVVKPAQLALDTDSLAMEQSGATRLKHVASLDEAIGHLRQTATDVRWHQADSTFFA